MISIDPRLPCPRLGTERLVLRELRLDDARAVASRAGDRRVARYLIAVPSPYPVSLATRWLISRIAWWPQGRGVTLAITRRALPVRTRLHRVQLRVEAAARHELVVGAGLGDARAVEHHDLVRHAYGRESM